MRAHIRATWEIELDGRELLLLGRDVDENERYTTTLKNLQFNSTNVETAYPYNRDAVVHSGEVAYDQVFQVQDAITVIQAVCKRVMPVLPQDSEEHERNVQIDRDNLARQRGQLDG